MTWWGWILLATYLAGCAYALPRFAWIIADPDDYGIRGDDVLLGYFVGVLTVWAWPIVWPIYAWYRHAKARGLTGAGMLLPPRHIRIRQDRMRRENDLRERERRIAELERELGISR